MSKAEQAFLRWLEDRNYVQTKLELADFSETGRGMMATETIESGQSIIEIPYSLLFTCQTPEVIAAGNALPKKKGSLNEHQALAIFLATVRERGGLYKPYIDVIPSNFTVAALMPPNLCDLLPWDIRGSSY